MNEATLEIRYARHYKFGIVTVLETSGSLSKIRLAGEVNFWVKTETLDWKTATQRRRAKERGGVTRKGFYSDGFYSDHYDSPEERHSAFVALASRLSQRDEVAHVTRVQRQIVRQSRSQAGPLALAIAREDRMSL